MAVTVTGVTIVKRFTYRGDNQEEFSSTYHFVSAPPGDTPSWTVVMNDVLAKEKPIYTANVAFVRFYGYDQWAPPNEDTPHHVFAHDWEVPGPPPVGTMTTPAGHAMAGDQAAMCWWRMNRLSVKGKPIYLRKYIHAGYVATADPESLDPAYKVALTTYVGGAGIQAVHGGLRSGSHDDTVQVSDVSPWVTTRTLKRRGKRPVPKA